MSLKLENVAEQIKDYTESLAYSGLNFVSKENIKQIEFFLQNASQLETYRLATSLRYLHVELKRFLENRAAFNIERYVFFLSNCWLLSRAFQSHKNLKEKKPEIFDRLMVNQEEPEIRTKFILKVVGIEKIHLEGTIVGMVFYFLSLFGKTRGKILKWNLMLPFSSGLTPEGVLHLELPHSAPKRGVASLLQNYVEADNIAYNNKDGIIFLEKNPESMIYIDTDSEDDVQIYISKLNKFYINSNEIYKKCSNVNEIAPFDPPVEFLDYIYVKDVRVIEYFKEGEEEDRPLTFVYTITHMEDYPLVIRIPDKRGNQKLIEEFNKLKGRKSPIEGIFCKLNLERGQLSVYPLSIINNNQILFPNLKKNNVDNRELLKSFYKVK